MKKIVAVGGGSILNRTTLAIDREIIRLSGSRHPRLLFIPTASSDDVDYWKRIDDYFGRELGCKTDVLWLLRESPSKREIADKIASAGVIYVGGGNTLKMMRRWRLLGIPRMLDKAGERGAVLCGASAGAICWFDSGHSDSMSYYNPRDWDYVNVRGLGFAKGVFSPHYDSETLGVKRKKSFHAMLRKIGGVGIAVEDNCAIEILGDKYRVISSTQRAAAYRVFKKRGAVVAEPITKQTALRPLAELFRVP